MASFNELGTAPNGCASRRTQEKKIFPKAFKKLMKVNRIDIM